MADVADDIAEAIGERGHAALRVDDGEVERVVLVARAGFRATECPGECLLVFVEGTDRKAPTGTDEGERRAVVLDGEHHQRRLE